MCERCNDKGYIGLPSLPLLCDCGIQPDEPDAFEAQGLVEQVTRPEGFARLCAFIGYTDEQCVTALVSETDLSADAAAKIVEEQYARRAAREAKAAADEWLNSNADTFGKEE